MADTQAIKDRIDIVQLIGEYITVKKAGANWKANCPFHHEKSPSFMVHPEKQIWHCFGCGKGGDIFSFVQEMEGLEFIEALKFLGKRAGVEIDTYKSQTDQSERNRLLEVTAKAAEFFHNFLLEIPASKPARDYLENRGLSKESLKNWQVGYAPDQWELLTKYLLKKGHGIDDLVKAGVTIKRDGADAASGRGFYDRFRGRIMFPICDIHGSVVGFTGRILVETENSGGKYVNTPQTILYDKSRVLYGLNRARQEIKSKDLAIIVEGQMDVIACHQSGMTNVVAASGTALTQDQVRLLKRYTGNLAMAFDADAAGENAGKRGIQIAVGEGLNVRVIEIPNGFAKDADECLKKDKNVWFEAVKSAKGVMEWYLENTLKKFKIEDPKEKQKAVMVLLEQIKLIPHAVERDDWLKKVSDALSVELSILRDEIKKVKNSVQASQNAPAVAAQIIKESAEEALLGEFWSLIAKYPGNYALCHPSLKSEYFAGTAYNALYQIAEKVYNSLGHLSIPKLRLEYSKESAENLVDVLELKPYKNLDELDDNLAKKEIADIIVHIKDSWRKKRGREIQAELKKAELARDQNAMERLLRELQDISK